MRDRRFPIETTQGMIPRVLSSSDFEELFQDSIGERVRQKIDSYGLTYREIDEDSRDRALVEILRTLLDNGLVKAGQERHGQWELGWEENLRALEVTKRVEAVVPRYFGKRDLVRLNRRLVKAMSEDFEYRVFTVVMDWLFDKYMADSKSVYEFGCGTGYNLLRLREYNRGGDLWGLDWTAASRKIIEALASLTEDPKLFARSFDYFNPDPEFHLKEGAVVYTAASLEQVGERFVPFLDYLLEEKPSLVVNVEPIEELLDPGNLMDYLSLLYFRKRNYLSGYLTYLRKLEREGKIEILACRRSNTGSFFIEGHSVLVWRPMP